MGKASSSKKVARAARAAGRPGVRRNYTWPALIGLIVALGSVLIVVTVAENKEGGKEFTGPPQQGDHWHAAYGVFICGNWVPPFADGPAGDKFGIHTHEDGLMHIHPFFTRVSGKGANVQALADDVGLKVSDTKVSGPGFPEKKNGDKCGTKAGEWKLVTWDTVSSKPKTHTSNFGKWAPKDQSLWALAFVPKGATVPQPESAAELAHPSDLEGSDTTPTSSVPVQTTPSSSAPPESSSTTASSTP